MPVAMGPRLDGASSATECVRLRLFGRAWIVAWPRCWAYGDFLLGICTTLAFAQAEGADVILIRHGSYASDAGYDAGAHGVRVWRFGSPVSYAAIAFLVTRGAVLTAVAWAQKFARDLSALVLATARSGDRMPRIRREWQRQRKERRRLLAESPRRRQLWHGRDQFYYSCDVRRLLAEQWTGATLGARTAEAADLAASCGLDASRPLVTVHVREEGWHGAFTPYKSEAKDAKRNADIRTFFPVFDHLVALGFTVVRLGDPTMTPIKRAGVVDLAHSGLKDNLLQVWAVQRSRFMIGCDSGPFVLAWLFGVPLLMVNVVCNFECYPLRAFDRMLSKAVFRLDGTFFSGREVWQYEFLSNYKSLPAAQYVDNSSHELLAAVDEMLALTSHAGPPMPTPQQRELQALADGLNRSAELMDKRRRRPDPCFVFTGNGFVSRVGAEMTLGRNGADLCATSG